MKVGLWNEVCSNGQQPFFETFFLEGEEVRPLIVVCPGGGYTHFGALEQASIALKFNAMGFHAVVLTYRIAPVRFPDPTLDLLRTIKIIRKNASLWHVDPERIAALGFSAGGHLALSAAVYHGKFEACAGDDADKYSGRPDALILCYPAISANLEFGNHNLGKVLAGGVADEEIRQAASLENFVDENCPPTFIWQTANDGAVNYRNALIFAGKLWELKVKCSLHIFPEGPHGRGLAEEFSDLKQWPDLAGEFLRTTCGF